MKGFDRVALYYDFLAQLVFGNAIVSAQEYYLKEIKAGNCVLIIGGGTGWILDSIFRLSNPGEVWFVDSSPKMMARAKASGKNQEKIHFVTGTIDQLPNDITFDVVITNFFLDMFTDEQLPVLIRHILKLSSAESTWLSTDFVNTEKWFHKLLLKSMYIFFGLVTRLENKQLPDWERALLHAGLSRQKEKRFYSGFITAIVFANG